jgi:hypothetical protein
LRLKGVKALYPPHSKCKLQEESVVKQYRVYTAEFILVFIDLFCAAKAIVLRVWEYALNFHICESRIVNIIRQI